MAAMMKLSLWFQFLLFLLGEAPSPGFSMMEQETIIFMVGNQFLSRDFNHTILSLILYSLESLG